MGAIAGYTHFSDPLLLHRMMAEQQHRGKGNKICQHLEDGCILAYFATNDPLSTNTSQRYTVVYDGFIANKGSLKEELGARGLEAAEEDGTLFEQLWQVWGKDSPLHMEGMYAFALWDREEKRLWLFRDRTGSKALYYCRQGDMLYFASTIQALLASGIRCTLDPEGLDDYLAFLHPLAPRTFYKEIRQVPAGHCLMWHEGEVRLQKYWKPVLHSEHVGKTDWLEKTEALLAETVQAYDPEKRSTGTLLSGGLDSAVVSTLLSPAHSAIPAFTLAFDKEAQHYDERQSAGETASLIGATLHEVPVAADLPMAADRILTQFQEPFGNPSALLADLLFQEAAKHVHVVFSGDGGDEGFGGYPRYRALLWHGHYRRVPHFLHQNIVHPFLQFLPESTSGTHTIRRLRRFSNAALLEGARAYGHWMEQSSYEERHALYTPELSAMLKERQASDEIYSTMKSCAAPDLLTAAVYTDISLFLPGNVSAYGDRMSAAHGIAFRTPLTEGRLLEHLLQVPAPLKAGLFQDKQLLRQILRRRLPQKHFGKKKMGLDPPMGIWLRKWRSLPEEAAAFIKALTGTGLFKETAVQQLVDEHLNQRRDHSWRLWSLLVLSRWQSP